MELPPTPVKTLEKCIEESKKVGLRYVYIGNVAPHPSENTYCYNCGALLIQRWGFHVAKNEIKNGLCSKCGAKIDGIGL